MTSSILSHCQRIALAGTLVSAWTSGAAAQERTSVALHTTTCSPSDDAALRRALEVELRAMHIEPRWQASDSGAPARLMLQAKCSDDSHDVSLHVWANEPQLVLTRSVALRDVAEPARARTVALVISEALGTTLDSRADTGDDAAYVAAATAAGASGSAPPRALRSSEDAAEPISEPAPEPAASTLRPRSRGGSAFSHQNPYGEVDELYTTSNPYDMAHRVRLGATAQGRLAARDGSVLLGFEVGASGPVSDTVDWAVEMSHAGGTTLTANGLDVSAWSAALGVDFVSVRTFGLSAGPRLAFGYLGISDADEFGATTESTLVSQLGLRSKLEVPVGELTTVQMTIAATHTLGVYALTSYTGLDEGLNGWVLSWGLGVGIEP